MLKRYYLIDLLALFAGGVLPLAFAPFGFYPLAIIALFFLLITWIHSSPLRAFWRGWLFGLGMYAVGVSWVYISIHRYGNTAVILSLLLTLLFITLLALFPAVNGYLLQRFFPTNHPLKVILTFPASWVIFEWLRSWLFTGFPWLFLGASQTNSPLRGFAPITGEFGISFLVVLSSSLLFLILQQKKTRRYAGIIILLGVWLLAEALTTVHWTESIGNPLTVSLIQGDIPQQVKWDPNQVYPTLLRYQQLTDQAWNSQIIIWPEAAITLPLPYAQEYITHLSKLSKNHHTALLTGIPVQVGGSDQFYNAVIGLGEAQGEYHKRHLVPFGEYVPFQNLLRGIINFFNLPMSEFIPGNKHQLIHAVNINIAPFICYEIAYANLVRTDLPQAQLLMTVSNDSWFGDSIAAWQHLQIAQMRSLESGRYMLFTTNNGVTAIISPQGKVIKLLPRFQAAILKGQVYAMSGATPWIDIGNSPIVIALFLFLLIAYKNNHVSARKKLKISRHTDNQS